jgi:hypothetical protein
MKRRGKANQGLYLDIGEDYSGGGDPSPQKRHTKNLAIEKIYRTFMSYLRGKLQLYFFRGIVYSRNILYIQV